MGTVSAICGHRLNATKIIHGVPWALQGKQSDVLGERLQAKDHPTKPTFKWRKYKYSLYIVTPAPQEGKKKFPKKRIRKEEEVAEGGERKKEKDETAAAPGWIPFSCSVGEGDLLSITEQS